MRQILIRTGAARTEPTAMATADFIVKQLGEGSDMEELAKEYSEGSDAEKGGDMGWIKEGQLMERINSALFQMKVGEYSDPIKTQLGFHVFKVEDRRESAQLGFDQVRSQIKSLLYRQHTKDKLKEWLAELREDAYIEHKG